MPKFGKIVKKTSNSVIFSGFPYTFKVVTANKARGAVSCMLCAIGTSHSYRVVGRAMFSIMGRAQICQYVLDCGRVFGLAFPNNDYLPAKAIQAFDMLAITLNIAIKLRKPVVLA